jgi:hypothetical protein
MYIHVSKQAVVSVLRKEVRYSLRMKTEAADYSKILLSLHQTARRHIPEDRNHNVIEAYLIHNLKF